MDKIRARLLAKAKIKDGKGNNWVEGNIRYDFENQTYWIQYLDDDFDVFYEIAIDENTICQCTGLRDNNGCLIYENDVLESKLDSKFVLEWNDEKYRHQLFCIASRCERFVNKRCEFFDGHDFKVVGNIHDKEWRGLLDND